MSTMNQVILTGYIGRDLKLLNFTNGQKLAVCPLATYDFYDDDNNVRHMLTDWHNISFRNDKADLALKMFKKGSYVHLQGKLKHRTRLKHDKEHSFSEVVVNTFKLLQSPIKIEEDDIHADVFEFDDWLDPSAQASDNS